MLLDVEEVFKVGQDNYFDSVSPKNSNSVVFEDNTETGYFYAAETSPDLNVLDALHIYNVADVIDNGQVYLDTLY
jgi:hypothetical protein